MFINTKKTIKITADNGREVFEARAGWIGEVPQWVENHWYFKALCKDGSITAIVSSKDKDIVAALEPPKGDTPPAATSKTEDDSVNITPPVCVETPKTGKGSK